MTNTKTMKNTNTKAKTKTQEIRDGIYHVKTKKNTECLKDPTYAILLYFQRAEGLRISNITF